jgi:hypothetical protein
MNTTRPAATELGGRSAAKLPRVSARVHLTQDANNGKITRAGQSDEITLGIRYFHSN